MNVILGSHFLFMFYLTTTHTYLFRVRSSVNVEPKASSWKLAWARWTSYNQGDKLIYTSENKHMLVYKSCHQSVIQKSLVYKKNVLCSYKQQLYINEFIDNCHSTARKTHKSHSCASVLEKNTALAKLNRNGVHKAIHIPSV